MYSSIIILAKNGKNFNKVSYIPRISSYAKYELKKNDDPINKESYMIGKLIIWLIIRPYYLEHGKTFGDNPFMYENVIYTSLTGVSTPKSTISEEHKKLWKDTEQDALIKSKYEKINYVNPSIIKDNNVDDPNYEPGEMKSIAKGVVNVTMTSNGNKEDEEKPTIDVENFLKRDLKESKVESTTIPTPQPELKDVKFDSKDSDHSEKSRFLSKSENVVKKNEGNVKGGDFMEKLTEISREIDEFS